jgi:glycosyltransferase involved in cell wall biosynthesis
VIPNPVEIPTQAPAGPDGKPLILCLNRLHPRKGVLPWVEALLQLRDEGLQFSAVHAGHEEDREYTRQVRRVAEPLLKEQRLSFRGAVTHQAAQELVARCAMLVHPATGFENFGLVISEGMAAARPVVASRRALVTPELESAGVVIGVEPEAGQLADAMRRLLQDADLRSSLGNEARDYATTHFSYEVVGKLWRTALEELV